MHVVVTLPPMARGLVVMPPLPNVVIPQSMPHIAPRLDSRALIRVPNIMLGFRAGMALIGTMLRLVVRRVAMLTPVFRRMRDQVQQFAVTSPTAVGHTLRHNTAIGVDRVVDLRGRTLTPSGLQSLLR
jgi:hypothetical protein